MFVTETCLYPLLNRYNIVVFGGVDGYSRKVIDVFLCFYSVFLCYQLVDFEFHIWAYLLI